MSDRVFSLTLMAETNTKLERLLAQSADRAFHPFGNFDNRRPCLRMGFKRAMFVFAPRFTFHNSLSSLGHSKALSSLIGMRVLQLNRLIANKFFSSFWD